MSELRSSENAIKIVFKGNFCLSFGVLKILNLGRQNHLRFAIFEISHETKKCNGKREKTDKRNAVLLARRYTFKKFQGREKEKIGEGGRGCFGIISERKTIEQVIR